VSDAPKLVPQYRSKKYKSSARVNRPISLGNSAFPQILKATLRYAETIAITIPALSATGSYTHVCNGLYDPNFTGTGHQPLYFDQMMAIYDHYNVIKSKITYKISSTNPSTAIFTCYIDDDTTTSTSTSYASERGGQVVNINPLSGNFPPVTQYWTRDKAFGRVLPNMSEFRGTASANPNEIQCFQMNINQPDLAGGTYQVVMEMEFVAEFTELATIAAS